jgi:hypothetical protein
VGTLLDAYPLIALVTGEPAADEVELLARMNAAKGRRLDPPGK